MVVEARLRIRHHGCYSEELVDGARLVHFSSDRDHCLSLLQAASEDDLGDLLELVPYFDEGTVVERGDGWVVARCSCQDDAEITPVIRAMGCTIVYPTVETDGLEHFTVLAPSRDRLRALVDRLEELGDVRLDRVVDVPGDALEVSVSLSTFTRRLSPRQLEALVAAIHAGYYDQPRRLTAEDLAERMGVARSTFQEHLRKAEQAVMEGFARLLLEHPALVQENLKGPGRPADAERAPALHALAAGADE